MKTHTLTTYKFSELSPEAQETALEWERDIDDLYGWHDDNQKSLKEFAKWLNAKENFEVSLWGYSYAKVTLPDLYYFELDEDEEVIFPEMSGEHLQRWLGESHYSSKYNKSWKVENSDCPFTGYYMDEELLDPMREYLANPDETTTLQDLADESANRWLKAYIADWEYQYSDEGLTDFLEANEYEFLEDGTRFRH